MELRVATDAEKVARDHVTFAEWGTGLSLQQYLDREAKLRAHPFSKGMRTWLLTEGSAVLASCETYDNGSSVGAVAGRSSSIASVFTEEAVRGKGYATGLMDQVLLQLAKEPGQQGCVLYSDVGERIYARSGYRAVPSVDWVLSPSAASSSAEPLPALVAPEAGRAPEATLRLHPSLEQLDWALARQRLYAGYLRRTPPACPGARAGDALALWAAYFKSNELVILWLERGSDADTTRVLDAARAEAHRCGLERVRLWALDGAPPAHASVLPRKAEIPMFAPVGRTHIAAWTLVQRASWV